MLCYYIVGESMIQKNIYIFSIILLLIASFTITVASNNLKIKTDPTDEDVDVPIWKIGDSWIYDSKLSCKYPQLSFQGNLDDIEFTVINNLSEFYELDFSGNIKGDLTINQKDPPISISGTLIDTKMEGIIFIKKSSLGVKQLHTFINGSIMLPLIIIPFPFKSDVSVFFNPVFESLDFPIIVGKEWNVSSSEISIKGNISILGLIERSINYTNQTGNTTSKCLNNENITVEAGNYNSFKIVSQNNSSIAYYAPLACNIIKLLGNSPELEYIELELISTTITPPGAPNIPDRPTGPTFGKINTQYNFSTSASDPDGDQIFYKWNWSDGTNSIWHGPYNSGEYITVNHSWNFPGEYQIKVKAMDTSNMQSQWSEVLVVNIYQAVENFTISTPRNGFYVMGQKIFDLSAFISDQSIPFSFLIGEITIETITSSPLVNFVEFKIQNVITNTSEIHIDKTQPFGLIWNGNTGLYTINAIAKDFSEDVLADDLVIILKII